MRKIYQKSDQTRSAVLFLIFNRPDTTRQVFDQIRKARPRKLYVACDGPRADRPQDKALCDATRSIISGVDWECEVHTLFRKHNLGCKASVSSALDWFFLHEEEGIILEDDCVPAVSFFNFCDTLLEKYRDDSRIRHISGGNYQLGKKWGDASYYFSNLTHAWGWASWRRVWKDYDKNLQKYSVADFTGQIRNIFDDDVIVECWVRIFSEVKSGKINSWAYPLTFINFFNNSLSIIPNVNLINNIGFDNTATHTTSSDYVYAHMQTDDIREITHPKIIIPQRGADLITINNEFDVYERKRVLAKQGFLRYKIKNWFRSLFTKQPLTENADQQLVMEHA